MKRQIKRFTSVILACAMLVGTLIVKPENTVAAPAFSEVGGWYETIYAELSGVSDSDVTGVSYSGTMSGSLTGDDLKYLVRNEGNGVRIDIPGVKAGTYTLTVTTKSGTITKKNITVAEYDRSGYAHYNYTSGVGAYNDDGTLKKNAVVLYVTDENKDQVSVTSKDGTTVVGIGQILNSSGRDAGDGLTPKGGKPNKNNSIMRRLADDNTPVVVRIIGTVTAPDGLTKRASTDYGGFLKDQGNMAAIQSGKNVTIEGIGDDAWIDGWGFHFMCQSDYPDYGKSFEVRNLSFKNVPEDCVGMDGVQSGSSLKYPVERIWVHHCAFHVPTIDNPTEEDKSQGDGAVDFKKGQYFTNSYCYYDGYNKTNLLGGNDENVQYNLSYHHNYWKNCNQRMPLARAANIHMYNNYVYGAGSWCMEVRTGAYIFTEYSIYEKCNTPASVKSGVIKSYQNQYVSCSGTNKATIVTDKSKTVSSDNKYANFDTNSSLSYIPSGNYVLDTTVTKEEIIALAGPMSADTTIIAGGEIETQAPTQETTTAKPQETTKAPETTTQSQQQTTAKPQETTGSSGGGSTTAQEYAHNFSDSGLSSSFYTISGNTSTSKGSVTYNGSTLKTCLKMESSTSISFNADAAGTLTLVFGGSTDAAGKSVKVDGSSKTIGSDSILTIDLAAGSHTITKGDSINLFYMVYTVEGSGSGDVHEHSYTATVTKAATCSQAGVKTYTCSCGASYTEEIPATGAHSYTATVTKAATCTESGVKTYTCSCGDSYTEEIVATGHNYSSEWTVDVEATTTTEGSKSRHCTVCGAKTDVTVIPKLEVEEVKNGLILENGIYYYYVDGAVATGYTDLVYAAGTWWYIENGVNNSSYTGVFTNASGTWYIMNGKLDSNYTGIRYDGTDFWYVQAGKVNTSFVGLYNYADAWWYVKDGKIQTDYKGMIDYSGYTWYVVTGKVDITFTGLGLHNGVWYCVQAGKVNMNYSGLVLNGGSWWYVQNGVLDTSMTGIVETGGSQWLVGTGKLQSTYTGSYTYNGVKYTIINGKVQ